MSGALSPEQRERLDVLLKKHGLDRSTKEERHATFAEIERVLVIPSERELEVLQLIASGYTNAEIGERLIISEETAKSHLRHLLSKLDARNRAHLVAIGYELGMIGRIEVPGLR